MSVILSEIRPGAYFDSVVLMQLQRALAKLPGIEDAGVVMATPANCDLLDSSGLLVESKAGSDDLLIVVKSAEETAAKEALGQVDRLLARRRSQVSQTFHSRSVAAAFKQLPGAKWVAISVPGRYAAEVARDALRTQLNVFLYSDNVSLSDEIRLKKQAAKEGLIVMGPDCGTAILGGVGLGFANRVKRGRIGLVGASGTGLQAITTAVDRMGEGISQALGTGGRDLSGQVGAISTLQGLDLLSRDAETEVIVLVSKPPESDVAGKVLSYARSINKPVVIDFIGYVPPARKTGNLHFALNLKDAAQLAVSLVGVKSTGTVTRESRRPVSGYVRGLFSGGTLAYEALTALQTTIMPLYSNIGSSQSHSLPDLMKSQEHTILDLGEDSFTQGRLHPMMDNDLRLRRFRQESQDPEVGLILMDVVLGDGAHANPAAELAPAIAEAIGNRDVTGTLEVVLVIVGSEDDPQDYQDQIERLQKAGAYVFHDVVEAADHISARQARPTEAGMPAVDVQFVKPPLSVINVGLELFHDSIVAQGGQAVHVDWRPPAGGNEQLMAILAKMKGI